MIAGHDEQIRDLRRLADRGELAHGYLFFGPPRVGKGQVALGLASYLETGRFDVVSGGEPEKKIPVLLDTLRIAPEPSSMIGIDEIRTVRRFFAQTPLRSRYRTVLVCDAETLSSEAQNALLKITEEPPAHSLIILTASDPERLLPTVRSRLHAIYFGTVPQSHVAAWAKSAFPGRGVSQELIRMAGGAPGLLWSLLLDERVLLHRRWADAFLAAPASRRGALAKTLVEDPTFSFDAFLEALQVALSRAPRKRPASWHAVCSLRARADSFNLNPRLQLTALGAYLGS